MSAVVARRALVKGVEVDGMLEGTVLDEGPVRDEFVVLGQAPDEAKVDLRLGVEFLDTELDDVAQALGGPVLAFDAVVGGFPGGYGVSTMAG